jgi:hypothetical protein
MDVFISWAGKRSGAVAEALKDWIPMVINAARPWLSKAHIPSGKLWRTELAENLATCKFGIFCLTPSALTSYWMFFEAGAISKTLSDSYVCPLLIDLKVSDIDSPFADFQCRLLNRDDIRTLVETLNTAVPDDSRVPERQLRNAFEELWPFLAKRIAKLPAEDASVHKARDSGEILEEILSRVRALEQRDVSPHLRVSKGDLFLRSGKLLQDAFPDCFPQMTTIKDEPYIVLRIPFPNGHVGEPLIIAPLQTGQSDEAYLQEVLNNLVDHGLTRGGVETTGSSATA